MRRFLSVPYLWGFLVIALVSVWIAIGWNYRSDQGFSELLSATRDIARQADKRGIAVPGRLVRMLAKDGYPGEMCMEGDKLLVCNGWHKAVPTPGIGILFLSAAEHDLEIEWLAEFDRVVDAAGMAFASNGSQYFILINDRVKFTPQWRAVALLEWIAVAFEMHLLVEDGPKTFNLASLAEVPEFNPRSPFFGRL